MTSQAVNIYLNPDAGRKVCQWIADNGVKAIVRPHLLGPNVLELGYGDGTWTGLIIELFGASCIVDMEADLIRRAEELYKPAVDCHICRFEEFNPSRVFNTILAGSVLEHVDDPVLILRKAKNWLAPQGRLIVIVPNAESLHRRLAVELGIQKSVTDLGPSDHIAGHKRVYTTVSIQNDITAGGFTINEHYGCFLKPLPQRHLAEFDESTLQRLLVLGQHLPTRWCAELIYICKAHNT